MSYLKPPLLQPPLFATLGLLCLLTVPQVVAQPEEQHPIDKKTEACITKDDTTVGMQDCLAAALQQWDKELNKNYETLMKQIDQNGKKALKNSQRQWLTYRDEEFKAIETIYGALQGTLWGTVAGQAKVEIVKHRTLELKDYLDNLNPEK